jgi:hypothetical protein
MHTFVSAGCSAPFIVLHQFPIAFAGEQSMLVQLVNDKLLDTDHILLFLVLHALEILTIVAEEK